MKIVMAFLVCALAAATQQACARNNDQKEGALEYQEQDVAAALKIWLAAFDAQSIRMRDQLNPPASPDDVAALEKHIGQTLPAEARALYLIADGQQSPFKVTYRMPEAPNIIELPFPLGPGEYVGNLFGGYEFLSLEEAAKEWDNWASTRADYTPEELANDFDSSVTVREGDPVLKAYTHPGWLPIAQDGGGNSYAIDLAPTEGGRRGQVIVIGPDEDLRRVIALSVPALFLAAAKRGIELDDGDDERIFFDMEGR